MNTKTKCDSQPKRAYTKPLMEKVNLVVEEAVLTTCKRGGSAGPGGNSCPPGQQCFSNTGS